MGHRFNPRTITQEQIDNIKQLRREKKSYPEISKALGIPYSACQLHGAGIVKTIHYELPENELQHMIARRKSGETYEKLKKDFPVTTHFISKQMKALEAPKETIISDYLFPF